MLLSDMGADVVTIDRPGSRKGDPYQIVNRGRTVVQADLKTRAGIEEVLTLLDHADVLVEGFRPGVMERLGLSPEAVGQRNPRLVYARMTGWGQDGPLAKAAGHDINYIAITGAMHAIGTPETPLPPLNLVGDYGGGSLYLVTGILAALLETRSSGRGQVVDAAISDGVISLMTHFVSSSLRGTFKEQRSSNMLDGGAPYYRAYKTADGEHVSVGPIEPQFFAEFCASLEVPTELRGAQNDPAQWPVLSKELEAIFRTRTQAEWRERLESTDACFAPVLRLSDAMRHPHNLARHAFVDIEGVRQPAPAPRFSRTPSAVQGPPAGTVSAHREVIARWARDAV
jgi:alpha-methylacyl-CoA racemase